MELVTLNLSFLWFFFFFFVCKLKTYFFFFQFNLCTLSLLSKYKALKNYVLYRAAKILFNLKQPNNYAHITFTSSISIKFAHLNTEEKFIYICLSTCNIVIWFVPFIFLPDALQKLVRTWKCCKLLSWFNFFFFSPLSLVIWWSNSTCVCGVQLSFFFCCLWYINGRSTSNCALLENQIRMKRKSKNR